MCAGSRYHHNHSILYYGMHLSVIKLLMLRGRTLGIFSGGAIEGDIINNCDVFKNPLESDDISFWIFKFFKVVRWTKKSAAVAQSRQPCRHRLGILIHDVKVFSWFFFSRLWWPSTSFRGFFSNWPQWPRRGRMGCDKGQLVAVQKTCS